MVNEQGNKKKNHTENKNETKKENRLKPENGGDGDVVADFVEDVWEVMTPELLERLRCVLTEDMGLSKKDADEFIQNQRQIRKQRICLKKDRKTIKIGPRNQWIKELSRDIANPMASFLVGILLSNRTSRTKKITERILERLCELTGENTTLKTAKTRIERTLVVVADRMATYFDEAITGMEKEINEAHKPAPPFEDWEKRSLATLISTDSCNLSRREETDLDQLSESELERLLNHKEKIKVKIQEQGDTFSDEVDTASKEEYSESEQESDEVTTTQDESEVSSQEEEVVNEESSDVEEEEAMEEEATEEEEEDEVDEEETETESEIDEEETGEQEGEEGKRLNNDEDREPQELEEIDSRKQLDILELLKEDIERTPKAGNKSERQMAVKRIIEKRFEELAKDKLDKSLDSIIKFDIDETASVVANWLEKILPSGDIAPELALVPSLDEKQGSAFEITEGEGSQYKVHKVSSTTVAAKVANVRGIEFPIRRKKLPRTMSPLNDKTTTDWADWALEAANVGEEWGKWLDNAVNSVEEHLLRDQDIESNLERKGDWKNWKNSLEHEAQKWRVEKRKLKGEAYLWNKKIESGRSVGPEKETNVVDY